MWGVQIFELLLNQKSYPQSRKIGALGANFPVSSIQKKGNCLHGSNSTSSWPNIVGIIIVGVKAQSVSTHIFMEKIQKNEEGDR